MSVVDPVLGPSTLVTRETVEKSVSKSGVVNGVPEWIVRVIQVIYQKASSSFLLKNIISKAWNAV